jgi:hypothetical protein
MDLDNPEGLIGFSQNREHCPLDHPLLQTERSRTGR